MSKRKRKEQITKQQKRERRRRRQRTAAAGRLPSQGAKMSEIPFELGQPWLDRLGPDPDLLVRRQNRRGVVDGSSIR
jgi:hypothetical protein